MEAKKACRIIVLDAGPMLKNEPAVSSLLAQCEVLISVPSIVSEIRDASARSRVETTLLPFLTLRTPVPESVKVVSDFARKTGDYEVLSRPDLHILALAYELECERNGGDWRLRRVPGQKGVNGAVPVHPTQEAEPEADGAEASPLQSPLETTPSRTSVTESTATAVSRTDELASSLKTAHISGPSEVQDGHEPGSMPVEESGQCEDSDSDGWITPSNIKKHQAQDSGSSTKPADEQKVMQVATITTDFAMQNVLLQMNLNLLSPSLQRVRHLKTYILRCHACFARTRDMSKQFCVRCGKPTLMRVSCSTQANGEFTIHLKKNMQWNRRGNVFSIPKPVGGSANGRVNVGGGGKGGGKGGWGQGLILAEDQKEYVQAVTTGHRQREKDLMDEDHLPSILTGERGRTGGRPKIGAGRNVNSRQKRMR